MKGKRRIVFALLAGGLVLIGWAHWPLAQALAELERCDSLLVRKSARSLELYEQGIKVATVPIALGAHPIGHKLEQGDERTPEGDYVIDYLHPRSSYSLALHISYPATTDRLEALRQGRDPGGNIMIHGLPNGMGFLGRTHRWLDWTNGCIALTNPEIRAVYRAVRPGTPIRILP